nr:uncharacterized protein LOC114920211 [Labrus bergylta]
MLALLILSLCVFHFYFKLWRFVQHPEEGSPAALRGSDHRAADHLPLLLFSTNRGLSCPIQLNGRLLTLRSIEGTSHLDDMQITFQWGRDLVQSYFPRRWQRSVMSGRMHGDVGRELLVPCLHPSLHLSPFCLLLSLSNLSSRDPISFEKPTILHFTFPQHYLFLCFPSYHNLFIKFSFAPNLFFFFVKPPVFLYPRLLFLFHFFPSPLARLFLLTIHLSLPSKPQNSWQQLIFAGQYPLVHKHRITSHMSPVCVCVSETHKKACTHLIRSNSSHLLEVTQVHTAMFLSLTPSPSICTAWRCCQSQL